MSWGWSRPRSKEVVGSIPAGAELLFYFYLQFLKFLLSVEHPSNALEELQLSSVTES